MTTYRLSRELSDLSPDLDGSDVGGSAQATDPHSIRAVYVKDVGGVEAAPFVVLDVYAFGTAYGPNGELDAEDDEAMATVENYGVTVMTFTTGCTDHTDPGSTEEWSDVTYGTDPRGEILYRTADEARDGGHGALSYFADVLDDTMEV